MENENLYRQELIQKYRTIFEPIFRYIPWFIQKQGGKTSSLYQGADMPVGSVPIPVYDSTLLGFVKDMQATGLMTRNYVYVYSRCAIRTQKDELRVIADAELKDIEDIFGIMAKYVLGGMTKGHLWSLAVENGVFLAALQKIKELLEVWDKPLA
ncbi:MAG: hypothetical protein IJO65_13880 [Lachnospiraceae bacterium]|nr:hypothetical protein [Lachnospiraceae bacterium]